MSMSTPSPAKKSSRKSRTTRSKTTSSSASSSSTAAFSPLYETPEKGERKSRSVAYERQGLTPRISPAIHSKSQRQRQQHSKLVYLIRHGESLGQQASRRSRQMDPALRDCGLSNVGRQQAQKLGDSSLASSVDLVLCSPLTRALETARLAFGSTTPILVHYHLREIGSPNIPENQPRRMDHVLRDVQRQCGGGGDVSNIDAERLQPPGWPDTMKEAPKVVRSREHVPNIFKWMAGSLLAGDDNYNVIAVVCHYHVIRAALRLPNGAINEAIKPENCAPIPCHLCPMTGRLTVIEQDEGATATPPDKNDDVIDWVLE